MDWKTQPIPEALQTLIKPEVLLRHRLVPLSREGRTLTVAVPGGAGNHIAVDDIAILTGMTVTAVAATAAETLACLLRSPQFSVGPLRCTLDTPCSQTWEALTPTADPLVRHCAACSQPVRLFPDALLARLAVGPSAQICVAVPAEEGLMLGGILPETALDWTEDELLGTPPAEDRAEESVEDVADAAMALIAALESQDPEAATGDLIFE